MFFLGVQSHTVNVNDGRVLVETNLPAEDVKSLIESTGRVAALIGTGGMTVKLSVCSHTYIYHLCKHILVH